MNKNRLLKMCACALVGGAIGFGIDTMIKKHKQKEANEVEVKEVKKDKTQYVVTAVDTVINIGCAAGAFYVFSKTLDYISEVDTKASVSNIINFINGAKLGIVDENTLKNILDASLPSLDETSKNMLEAYVHTAFPELFGGE